MTSMTERDLILARDLRGADVDTTSVYPLSREPDLTRVRRGAYVPSSLWNDARPAERYRLLVRATVAEMRVPAPLSHESAAVMLGIPIIGPWPEQVHVMEPTASGGRGSALVKRHGRSA